MTGTPAQGSKHGPATVIDGACQKVVITIEIEERCGTGTGGGPGTQGGPGPTATPFLVIPCGAGDLGARPLPVGQAMANPSIQDRFGRLNEVHLSCVVANLGAVPSSVAMIEFYVAPDISVWDAALTPAQVQAACRLLGRTSFVAPPGVATTVLCPHPLTTGRPQPHGVLTQVSDPFTDRISVPSLSTTGTSRATCWKS